MVIIKIKICAKISEGPVSNKHIQGLVILFGLKEDNLALLLFCFLTFLKIKNLFEFFSRFLPKKSLNNFYLKSTEFCKWMHQYFVTFVSSLQILVALSTIYFSVIYLVKLRRPTCSSNTLYSNYF